MKPDPEYTEAEMVRKGDDGYTYESWGLEGICTCLVSRDGYDKPPGYKREFYYLEDCSNCHGVPVPPIPAIDVES